MMKIFFSNYKRDWKITTKQDILTLLGIMILIVGLGISVFIYIRAENHESDILGYEFIDGHAYPVKPEDSKMYQRDLQMVGGKMYLLIDELQRWFSGLWHGKSLAFTLAIITVMVSSGFFYIANQLPSHNKEDGHFE